MELNKSYLTARPRKDLSAPMKYLNDKGLISFKHLDYGCGRGSDADIIGSDRYDPYWFKSPLVKKYDTITCIYVLNVIPDPDERKDVLDRIYGLLRPKGTAYIAVRRDRIMEGYTALGTWQGEIKLDLPIEIEQKGKYCIYKLTKEKL